MIEVLDDPALIGGIRHGAEIIEAYLADHAPTALVEYGDRLGNRAVFKRLGYIAERTHYDADGLVTACRDRISRGVSLLDPTGPAGGTREPGWGLRVNVGTTREPS
ncbi:MAG: hypothetical protein ACRD29_21930 [Acidimicrobiales bacterium]